MLGNLMEDEVSNSEGLEVFDSTVMDSKGLCDFCDAIDFGAAGFCGSRLDYGTLPEEERPLDDILRSSEQCFFCGKIADLFRDWRGRKFGSEQAVDLERAHASFFAHFVRSLEVNDEGQPKGYLIRFLITLNVKKPTPSRSSFGPSIEFQKCSQHPLTVAECCNAESLFDWENGREEEAYSGRIRPLVADTRLFRKWKESCCDMHGDDCNLIITGKRFRGLRLVDVEDRCVVDSDGDGSYTALSYVWGGATLPLLTRSTEQTFRERGSLNATTLPSTIDDAIELTRSLGEKHIWIDCLCIMQDEDDDADKLRYIPQMDSIYGSACVTIVAASGVNAEAGLPGVKPKSRTQKQMPFTVKGISLVATLDPEGSGDEVSYLGECEWSRRGWTFQERLFSRRALIFTPEQVYWECQRASWCEDGLWETMKYPTAYRHSFADEDFRQPWGTDVDSFERIYRKLVDEYSARSLSKLSDGLHAFEGILHHFERHADQTFLWALPTSFLNTALTWPCGASAKRRLESCTLRSEEGTTTLCPFPSWSWVGWVGRIYYVDLFDKLNKFESSVDLIFYCLGGNGLRRIGQADNPQITHTNEDDHSPPLVWKDCESRTTVTSEEIPAIVLERSIASNILCFWSSAAVLHVRYDEVDRDKPSLSCNDKVVPGFWSHVPLLNPGYDEPAEFVVVGRENGVRTGNIYTPTLAVLFVAWENGVAYRRGLVNIKISDWMLLDNRVWKMICLG